VLSKKQLKRNSQAYYRLLNYLHTSIKINAILLLLSKKHGTCTNNLNDIVKVWTFAVAEHIIRLILMYVITIGREPGGKSGIHVTIKVSVQGLAQQQRCNHPLCMSQVVCSRSNNNNIINNNANNNNKKQ
jgi:hypothetical protein